MTQQPEALRLADALSAAIKQVDADDDVIHVARWFVEDAAAELRRLHASCEDYAQHKQRQDQRVLGLNAQRDALLEALKELTPPMPPADAPCHVGLVPQEKCAHCGRIARARAAIKVVEETK